MWATFPSTVSQTSSIFTHWCSAFSHKYQESNLFYWQPPILPLSRNEDIALIMLYVQFSVCSTIYLTAQHLQMCCNMYVWSVYKSILLLAAPLPSNTVYATEWAVRDLLMTMKHWQGLQHLVSTSHATLTQLAVYWFSNRLIREIIFVIIVIWLWFFMLGWKKWKQQRWYIPSALSLTAEPTGNPNIMNLKNHNYLIIVINLHIQI